MINIDKYRSKMTNLPWWLSFNGLEQAYYLFSLPSDIPHLTPPAPRARSRCAALPARRFHRARDRPKPVEGAGRSWLGGSWKRRLWGLFTSPILSQKGGIWMIHYYGGL